MPAAKRGLFEYPRPVSPVCADEIPICDDTIVYFDQNNGAAENFGGKATKRRRIEDNATAYLRGQPLFILTAQLRGPFAHGWQNPWSKRDVPQSKQSSKYAAELADTTKSAEAHASVSAASSGKGHAKRNPEPTATPPTPLLQNQKPTAASPAASNGGNRKVEDWLRRSKAPSEHNNSSPSRLSMTPSKPCQPRVKKWEPSPITMERFPDVDVMVDLKKDPQLQESNASLRKKFEELKKGLHSAPSPQAQAMKSQEVASQPSLEADRSSRQIVQLKTTKDNPPNDHCVDRARAEDTVLTPKNDSHHQPGPSTKVDPHTPDVEGTDSERPHLDLQLLSHEAEPAEPASAVQAQANADDTSDSVSASLHTAQEALPPKSTLPPVSKEASKEASKASSTQNLPSAQAPSYPILPSASLNLSSHSTMLPERLHEANAELVDLRFSNEPSTMEAQYPAEENEQFPKNPVLMSQFAGPGGISAEGSQAQDLQQTLNGRDHAASLGTRVINENSHRAPNSKAHGQPTSPRSVPTGGNVRTRKRATFATDEASSASTQVSIKSSLRVAKAGAASQDNRVRAKAAFLKVDNNAQRQLNAGQSPPRTGESISTLSRLTQAPKGVLKSALQASINGTAVSANAASASAQQDAQRQQKLGLIESLEDVLGDHDDDPFDADDAMDELGSFLGSWEAEKEAGRVVKAPG